MDEPRFDVFCGIDVGKHRHHVTGVDCSGRRLLDRGIVNDEQALWVAFSQLAGARPSARDGRPGQLDRRVARSGRCYAQRLVILLVACSRRC